MCCSVLPCVVLSVLQHAALFLLDRHPEMSDKVWCGALQCVAVCCSVLQCVAVCCCVLYVCSVLPCVYSTSNKQLENLSTVLQFALMCCNLL